MFKTSHTRFIESVSVLLVALSFISQLAACATDSYAAKGAAKGATTGAAAGAVGGLVSALVFGGDPLDRAARGAVYGGAAGATAGAMAGGEVDRQVKAQREAGLARLRQDIGDDAFDGLEALTDCRHEVSLRQAAKARQSANPNHALAGLWLEVLSYADQRGAAKVRSLFPTLVERDWNLKSEAQAEDVMRKAMNALMDIRQEYTLPRVCPAST